MKFSVVTTVSFALATAANAFVFTLSYDSREGSNDIAVSENYNALRNFDFTIDINAPLTAGGVYSDPTLNGVNYNIYGILDDPTPSNFSAFDLIRTIGGSEFYTQGSSLNFEISGSANLIDGLQASELVSFTFDGREVNTGRFHPAYLTLSSAGTGTLHNSNNISTMPPANKDLNVAFGEEYDLDLSFNASTLTLVAIPDPSAGSLLIGLVAAAAALRRRRRSRLE